MREFGTRFTVTDKPGDGVLRYRAAITGAKPEVEGGKNPLSYVPVMFVVRTATGANNAKAHLFMESIYTDSLTGEVIGEVVQSTFGGETDAKQVSLESLKPVLDQWAKKAVASTKRELGKLK